MYEYKTSGTCSRSILFDIEDGKVKLTFKPYKALTLKLQCE